MSGYRVYVTRHWAEEGEIFIEDAEDKKDAEEQAREMLSDDDPSIEWSEMCSDRDEVDYIEVEDE